MDGHAVFVLSIIFMVVVLPLFLIMHYATKWKATKGLSDDEQRMLENSLTELRFRFVQASEDAAAQKA